MRRRMKVSLTIDPDFLDFAWEPSSLPYSKVPCCCACFGVLLPTLGPHFVPLLVGLVGDVTWASKSDTCTTLSIAVNRSLATAMGSRIRGSDLAGIDTFGGRAGGLARSERGARASGRSDRGARRVGTFGERRAGVGTVGERRAPAESILVTADALMVRPAVLPKSQSTVSASPRRLTMVALWNESAADNLTRSPTCNESVVATTEQRGGTLSRGRTRGSPYGMECSNKQNAGQWPHLRSAVRRKLDRRRSSRR